MRASSHTPPQAGMRRARLYVGGLALVMLLAGGVFGIVGYRSGPPVGDLTRISGLPEADFGWQGSMPGYGQSWFRSLTPASLAAGQPDGAPSGGIVVFGDSFSAQNIGNASWLNELHLQTGLPVSLVSYRTLDDVRTYFRSAPYKGQPPGAVIIEMGERTVFRRARPLFGQPDCAPPAAPAPLRLAPRTGPAISWRRRTAFSGFDELMSWGASSIRLRLLSAGKTRLAPLRREDLFSSRKSGKLLFYQSDILRHLPEQIAPYSGPEALRETVCALRGLIRLAQGRAPVYVMIAPDKRTAYAPWIASTLPPRVIDYPAELPAALPFRSIDLLGPLRAEIGAGRRDVYLPDDTHWSPRTNMLVGALVARVLARGGKPKPAPLPPEQASR